MGLGNDNLRRDYDRLCEGLNWLIAKAALRPDYVVDMGCEIDFRSEQVGPLSESGERRRKSLTASPSQHG